VDSCCALSQELVSWLSFSPYLPPGEKIQEGYPKATAGLKPRSVLTKLSIKPSILLLTVMSDLFKEKVTPLLAI